jgi:hypothetical protein
VRIAGPDTPVPPAQPLTIRVRILARWRRRDDVVGRHSGLAQQRDDDAEQRYQRTQEEESDERRIMLGLAVPDHPGERQRDMSGRSIRTSLRA